METTATHIEYSFEPQYLALRQRENRIYTDAEVARLPEIDSNHIHYKEWQVRKQSCNRLLKFIENKKLNILEVGCGNGWLAARLAASGNCTVTGIDVNHTELEQAKRVFASISNLDFKAGTLPNEQFQPHSFDLILFAASIQYFSSLNKCIQDSMKYLKPGGSIHITDTIFYKPGEIPAAQKRSSAYFTQTGFPEMAKYYFHHSLNGLSGFNYKILSKPSGFLHKLLGKANPFYHIVITP